MSKKGKQIDAVPALTRVLSLTVPFAWVMGVKLLEDVARV